MVILRAEREVGSGVKRVGFIWMLVLVLWIFRIVDSGLVPNDREIDGPSVRVTYRPRPHHALRQNYHVGLLRGGSAVGNGGVGDKAADGEHASNSAATIFQQDETVANTAAKNQRWCQVNFPDFWSKGG